MFPKTLQIVILLALAGVVMLAAAMQRTAAVENIHMAVLRTGSASPARRNG